MGLELGVFFLFGTLFTAFIGHLSKKSNERRTKTLLGKNNLEATQFIRNSSKNFQEEFFQWFSMLKLNDKKKAIAILSMLYKVIEENDNYFNHIIEQNKDNAEVPIDDFIAKYSANKQNVFDNSLPLVQELLEGSANSKSIGEDVRLKREVLSLTGDHVKQLVAEIRYAASQPEREAQLQESQRRQIELAENRKKEKLKVQQEVSRNEELIEKSYAKIVKNFDPYYYVELIKLYNKTKSHKDSRNYVNIQRDFLVEASRLLSYREEVEDVAIRLKKWVDEKLRNKKLTPEDALPLQEYINEMLEREDWGRNPEFEIAQAKNYINELSRTILNKA